MTVENGSFEIKGVTEDVAFEWVITSGSDSSFVGFGDANEFWDSFGWGDLLYELDLSTSIWLFFNGYTELFEEFAWGGDYIEDWDSSWITSVFDTFDWSVFNETWVPGSTTGADTFDWSTFNDAWVPGDTALFNGGADMYESFETGW